MRQSAIQKKQLLEYEILNLQIERENQILRNKNESVRARLYALNRNIFDRFYAPGSQVSSENALPKFSQNTAPSGQTHKAVPVEGENTDTKLPNRLDNVQKQLQECKRLNLVLKGDYVRLLNENKRVLAMLDAFNMNNCYRLEAPRAPTEGPIVKKPKAQLEEQKAKSQALEAQLEGKEISEHIRLWMLRTNSTQPDKPDTVVSELAKRLERTLSSSRDKDYKLWGAEDINCAAS